MFQKRILCPVLAALCFLALTGTVFAAEVDCDDIYCFSAGDFSGGEDTLAGICITQLPDPDAGTVMLGSRVLQEGDILTAQQVEQMTFSPLRTESDAQAVVGYLPIYPNRVERSAVMTISIRGKQDQAPVAQDSSIETYKNLPNSGQLKVSDPEGQALTYTLVRNPRRGSVELKTDGTFVYTPKKNKVGVDSFTYTATDPAGKVSREATVTIQILKPTDSKSYTDTAGLSCQFEAEWLRNTGLFTAETVGGEACFQPDKTMSRGEFLAMVVKALDIPTDQQASAKLPENTPTWLRPYLTAALRSGLMEGLPEIQTMAEPITGAEVAVMLQNALDLTVSQELLEQTMNQQVQELPAWAAASLTVLQEYGVSLDANAPVTRGCAAELLYQVDQLAVNAPGIYVLRMQDR